MGKYDVFLSFNSKDRAEAAQFAYRLRDGYGLAVWFDQWRLPPGKPWMELIEQGLAGSEAAAVLVGAAGLGDWENEEMRAALEMAVADPARRVIPVLLPGCADPKTLSAFLRRRTWVDFRGKALDDREALDLLYCGIKDIEPEALALGSVEAPARPARLPNLPLGAIPAANVVAYVHRGQIEDDVRAFLKKGNGSAAIVGLMHAPGGLGKTELAKHASEDLQADFEGRLWVDVGDKAAPQVVAEMLIRCGVQLPPGASYEGQKDELQRRLAGRRYLIVFDDLRQAALDGLRDFLPPSPCVALLTSRIQQVGGVNETFALDHLTEGQARELLEAVLGRQAVEAEKDIAKKLAARCAFNPLALEIAARRIRQLQGIRKPIECYFEIVVGRFPELKMDGDARWDMEKVFDLSYLDLDETDRARFRALAAFHPTGFAPAAAACVWGVDLPEARAALSRFINLSLVKAVDGDFERYRLHDLLDEYAAGKLRENEAEEVEKRNALAEWVAGEFDDNYVPNDDNIPRLTLEKENLILSAQWAMQQRDGWRLGRLATTPANWLSVNFFAETWRLWKDWLVSALQDGIVHEDKKQASRLKANCIQALGDVHRDLSELPEARARYEEALPLYRSIGDKLGEANCIKSLGDVHRDLSELPAARARYEEALPLYRSIGDKLGEANTLSALLRLRLAETQDIQAAERKLEQVLDIRRRIGDSYGLAADYGNFAIALLDLGHKAKAKEYALKARSIFEQIGLPSIVEMMDSVIAASQ